MAKNRLTDWDTTAGNNTDVGGINIAEGWAPENVNNAARETMSQLAEFHGDITGKLSSAGAAGAYTLTTNDGVAAYAAGQLYMFIANHANSGAATLNVNAIGAKSIVKRHDVALEANDIEANQLVLVAYEATDDTFQMISQASVTELSIITTRGDLIRGDATGAAERYALGTAGDVLASDGTDAAWVGGATVITSGTVAAGASLDITGLASTYRAYMLVFDNAKPATDSVTLRLRTDSNNGASFDAGVNDYAFSSTQMRAGQADVEVESSTGASSVGIMNSAQGNLANEMASGRITIYNPAGTTFTQVSWEATYFDASGNIVTVHGSGARQDAAAVDAIQLLYNSGNIATMNYTLYGLSAS